MTVHDALWRAEHHVEAVLRASGPLGATESLEARTLRLAKRKEYAAAYYREHKAAYRERRKRWRAEHPEQEARARRALYARNKADGTARRYHLKSRYDATPEEEQALWDRQAGRCAICGVVLMRGDPQTHLDHDHATKRLRGFLCITCNQGLGRFRDDPRLLAEAIRYVEGGR